MTIREFITSPRMLAFLHDVFMAAFGFIMSVYLASNLAAMQENWQILTVDTVLAIVCSVPIFIYMGMYRGIWRYASTADLLAIIKASAMAIFLFLFVLYLVNRVDAVPRSAIVIYFFSLVCLLGGPRFAYRVLKDRRVYNLGKAHGKKIPVLLFGAGDEADLFIRSLMSNPDAPYAPVAVLDDKGRRIGRDIHGVKVAGHALDLERVFAELSKANNKPQRLIITRERSKMEGADLRLLFATAEKLGMTIARLPNLTEFKEAIADGQMTLKPVAVEDLLGRPQAKMDKQAIFELLSDARVVVTGAGGSIGSEIARQVAKSEPSELVLLDNCEFALYKIDMEIGELYPNLKRRMVLADIRNDWRIDHLFEEIKPHLIFHAAALKHVPMVEENVGEGVLTTSVGTMNVANAAKANNALAMVMISTDKAVQPTSVMGACKRVAESYCQALDRDSHRLAQNGQDVTRFMTVRFGNVLGSTGSVVPLFQRQLAAGGPLTVTHPDITRYFMTCAEAVQLVLSASAYGLKSRAENKAEEDGGIFVLDMGEPVKIADLARQMILLAGLRPEKDVEIKFTGLRAGEKLYEDLFDEREKLTESGADGIFLAHPRLVETAFIKRDIEELGKAAIENNPDILTLLKRAVPEYNPMPDEAHRKAHKIQKSEDQKSEA